MAKEKAVVNEKNGWVMPKKEIWIFAIGAGGQGMIYAMMSSYVSDYYVNVLQLPLIFVLLLMLLARVWDAINDPLMGMIADRHTTKWGKMKPYILFAAIPITILTILMYFAPEGLSKTELMVYTAFVYVFWGMFYTMADVPFWGLPNVLTPNAQERSQVISLGRTVNGVGSAVPEVLFLVAGLVLPGLLGTTGIEYFKQQYLIIAIVTVLIGIVLYANTYFRVKERIVPPLRKRQPGEPGQLKRIFTCKPLMLVMAMGVLSSGRYMVQAAAVHVARYAFYIGPEITADMEKKTHNLLLIGMPGCGKTTIGRELARCLNRPLEDVDRRIAATAGRPIPEIFAQEGEEGFRIREHLALCAVSKESGQVIACGGGIVTRKENWDPMRQNSTVIYLRRDLSLLPTSGRPMSQANPVEKLYRQRAPLYEQLADLTVENRGTPAETANEIIRRLGL